MKVSLNITEDAELRSHIKDSIRGMVMSIAREEIAELVRTEMERKIQNYSIGNPTKLDKMIGDSVHACIDQTLRPYYTASDSVFGKAVSAAVSAHLARHTCHQDQPW